MTIKNSGAPLSMSEINAEFTLGNSMSSLRGVTWYTDAGGTGTFVSTTLKFSDFYSKRKTSAATNITISSNAVNVNLFTLCGSPGGAGTFNITVNSGVIVGSSNTALPALRTGGFPVGSTITLINNGTIRGMGGAGGGGGPRDGYAVNGFAGGDAIYLDDNLIINNNSGSIFGGGGGGGQGQSYAIKGTQTSGGGGGGQGHDTSAGGADTAFSPGNTTYDGHSGNSAGPGTGGPNTGGLGGTGGTGGTWGNPGANGGAYGGSSYGPVGTGGIAGYAVRRNGKIPTWQAGNNGTQVKGTDA